MIKRGIKAYLLIVLSCFLIFSNIPIVAAEYSGEITNASPSHFVGNVETALIVTAYNYGESGTLIVDPVDYPSGWIIQGDDWGNTVQEYVSSGSSETFVFYVTAPENGGSGNIEWELLYDGWINTYLDTHIQSVSASAGKPKYDGKINTISPNNFMGGIETELHIEVENTGSETAKFEIITDTRLPGWDIDDHETDGFVNLYKEIDPGNTWTFTFYVTAPSEGGSGDILWELYHSTLGIDKLLDTKTQQVTAENAYKGRIISANPSSFTGMVTGSVDVTIKNNGQTGTFIVVPNSYPKGWIVSDGVLDGNNDIQKSVSSGSTETFTFYVTTPFLGGSGKINWELYYDIPYSLDNVLLHSSDQSVNAVKGTIDYSTQSDTIGYDYNLNGKGIPIEADLSFPISVTPIDKVNVGDTVEIGTNYSKSPFSIKLNLPESIVDFIRTNSGEYSKYIDKIVSKVTGFILDSDDGSLSYLIDNPMGVHMYPIFHDDFDIIVCSYSIDLFQELDGDVIGYIFIEGPATLEKDQISFVKGDNIILNVKDSAKPGEEIKVGLLPCYNILTALHAQLIFTLGIKPYDTGVLPLIPGGNTKLSYIFPPDGTFGFIITVNYPPVADASSAEPYFGFAGEEISFDGSSSSDSDGEIISYSWDFGDGGKGVGKTASHTYSTSGEYTVILTVTDDAKATDTYETSVVVSQPNRPPSDPEVTGENKGTKNTLYSFTFSSSDEDGDLIKYTIDWDDGTSTESDFLGNVSTFSTNHTWSSPGKYDIVAYADDNHTISGGTTFSILIDACYIDDLIQGCLIDEDGDGIYDKFLDSLNEKFNVERDANGSYNIDSNGDGEWEYSFNPSKGLTQIKNAIDDQVTPGFELVLFLWSVFLIVFYKRRKN